VVSLCVIVAVLAVSVALSLGRPAPLHDQDGQGETGDLRSDELPDPTGGTSSRGHDDLLT
jgi:hypothetical protein